jgi:hypothetical protein
MDDFVHNLPNKSVKLSGGEAANARIAELEARIGEMNHFILEHMLLSSTEACKATSKFVDFSD